MIKRAHKRSMFFDENNEIKVVWNKKGKLREPGSKDLRDVLRGADDLLMDFIHSDFYLGCLE